MDELELLAVLTKLTGKSTKDGNSITIALEIMGMPGDWLLAHLGRRLVLHLEPAEDRTPLEQAIEEAAAAAQRG